MENVWLGYVQPLNGLVPDDVLAKSGATSLSVFGGQQYRVGWYALGLGFAYNKDCSTRQASTGTRPPTTWDAFLDASTR